MDKLCIKDDYNKAFDIQAYLTSNFSAENINQGITQEGYLLKLLHQIFSTIKPKENSRLLDVGTGPSVYTIFSASRVFKDITLAEYAEQNREELDRWIRNDDKAFDWSAVLSVVGELEGINSSEIATRSRSAIEQVIPCDVTEEKILLDHERGHYDFVQSILCLEASCTTVEIHREAIAKLCRLLAKGGGPFLSGVLGESFYTVGNHKFFALVVTQAYLKQTLEECRMKVVLFESIFYDRDDEDNDLSDGQGMYYIHAIKN